MEEFMSKKEELLEYIDAPIVTQARNRMGCDENWYNPYYAIKETFSREKIENMSEEEVENLVELANEIGLALY
jgi:hypothetical protein